MPIVPTLASFCRNLFRRQAADAALDAELRAYVELLAAEKVRAGMTPEAARRAALVETGGVEAVKEEVRDVRVGALLDTVVRDVRFGLRSLRRSAGLTAAAIVALGLGIGATTTVFSVVDAVLLRPLPYADADRLVTILHRGTDPVAPANYLDWRRESRAFSAMGAAEMWGPNLGGRESAERLHALHVSASVFPLLGVRPLLGRAFAEAEEQPGNEHVVVIGYGLWQRQLGGDRAAVGRTITLDGQPYTIVGVMPESFSFPPFWAVGAELWAPLSLAARSSSRDGQSLRVFGRLASGVSLEAARDEMRAITTRIEREFPKMDGDVRVVALKERAVGDVRPALLVLLGAVGFVLLAACANVAHMLLARASARQRELAVRTALGAGRGRLARQLLTESFVLGLAGGAAGLLVASAGIAALEALGPRSLPHLRAVSLDGRALAFALAVSLGTSLLFGLAPALQLSAAELGETLRDGDRGSTEGGGRGKLRAALVASEFALAVMLLVGAGLMIRSFAALRAVDPGFDPRGTITAEVSLAGTASAAPGRRGPFFADLLARVRALPGVAAAGAINHLPITGDDWGVGIVAEGRPRPASGTTRATYRVVTPGYFAAMRIPILRGRAIGDEDRDGAPPAVIVNDWLARHEWPGEGAVGRRLTFDDPDAPDARWLTVVGVVPNVVRSDLAAPPAYEIYVPFYQAKDYLESPGMQYASLSIVARAACDPAARGCNPAALAGQLRRAVGALDHGAAVSSVGTMRETMARATAASLFQLVLLGAFAAVALVLAAVGIYGVMSYTVSRRRHEIGIRLALGATPGEVTGAVVRQGMTMALAGAAAGVAGALLLSRLMRALLYGVSATDPITFSVVTLTLGLVALGATWLPARRAAHIDPLAALRSE